ncbi:glycine-rich domain-containing protein 1 isoform X3 [Physcomitrium patens]|nr:glycine-rich domain-containing protein 1-like isoform X1 [Physcomitrium patens]XP_024365159.1 glycine-rich domain-containing protein 1-like isoform X1 [Physcomitrium patens]XP_024365160.1 glycine-rich domain-containing protein 1-like isoform X1 [Physcomitrium patens]|eukprot:XP_024365158.1 glycine-rich domain-containing protein 1-like isoform X1 [Physcomitrella patens]
MAPDFVATRMICDAMDKSQKCLQKERSHHEEELRCARTVEISVDLVFAAKRLLCFLRTIDSITSLHSYTPTVLRAIQRYRNCWMPLAAEAGNSECKLGDKTGTALLPSVDVQWVWHCHCLSPMAYRDFCKSKYGRVIDCPLLPDTAIEDAARNRCRKIWNERYKDEPFDIVLNLWGSTEDTTSAFPAEEPPVPEISELVAVITRQSSFYYHISQPYMWEEAFLQASLERYKCFLHIVNKSRGSIMCVPTYDIDLIWHAHQVSPVAYARDTKALLGCVVDHDDSMERGPNTKLGDSFEDTTQLWESTFGHPYERAGSLYKGSKPVNLPAPHDGSDGQQILEWVPVTLPSEFRLPDVNLKFPCLVPRRIVQVGIFIKSETNVINETKQKIVLSVRLRALQAHKLLKLDAAVVPFASNPQWQKLWLLHCEMATRGFVLEVRCQLEGCLGTLNQSKVIGSKELTWEALQNSPMLSTNTLIELTEKRWVMERKKYPLQLRLGVSIAPPVQGPYLLKSVPDRVTDDAGAMLSNLILRMNKYEPQRGRWISRTVLNHMGKECFVIRIRVAKGIWRKNGDRPEGVDWNERVIDVCEGGWTYVAGSIGYAPHKIVGTATPCADDLEHYRLSWHLSTGDSLVISRPLEVETDWEHYLEFRLMGSYTNLVRLINGRKLQYEVPNATLQEEEGFVTLIRYNAQAPQGKATALFNWRVSAMEIHPEEDVVLVLLLCTATMRSVADFGGKHHGNLFAQRRHKESKPGQKDWGSVAVENAASQSNLATWYLNTPRFTDTDEGPQSTQLHHTGPTGGACGSSCQAGEGIWSNAERASVKHQGWKQVANDSSKGSIGVWGRRTGSGIQMDLSRIAR